ncbi:hypothetical protein [Sulfodiicoccus acidiphilus]|nr:hypothetical protein [Sulfodiicoccus acidiphilus]
MELLKQLAALGLASAAITASFFDSRFVLAIPAAAALVLWVVIRGRVEELTDAESLKRLALKMGVDPSRLKFVESVRKYAFFPSLMGEGEILLDRDYAVAKTHGRVLVMDKYTAIEMLARGGRT